ncbi:MULTISPECIES: DUF6436 domain-containing protein [Gammaproteobacteria]|uniref:DUF6436 domain-containing protein n=1 Tax=Gammaproteobacteria TaxID=1236 RepID=UPI000DD0ED23|nr:MULTISPECIES: DUF6436 domain-containing protein [Gammaproteobacteria]RTE87622.1 hypothetical protein DQX04_04440 [Aliidiomarina sp. B3213]TCZ92593.1 hypothetical protein EYQ95_00855 [Lysobacter sp. N42]
MPKKIILVFVLWVGVTSAGLYFWALSDFGYFDEGSVWLGQTSFPLEQLEPTEDQGWLVVHIRKPNCRCNILADRHQQTVEWPANVTHLTLTEEQARELGLQVPAAPMLVMAQMNDTRLRARYAGPYASGPLCSANNSFIPEVLASAESQQTDMLWLNGNVKACRCT